MTWSDPSGLSWWSTAWSLTKGAGIGVGTLAANVLISTTPYGQIKNAIDVHRLAKENGGGFGGYFTAGNITNNPVYGVMTAVDSALQNGKQGNVEAAARDWTTAAGASALTIFGAKTGAGAVAGRIAPVAPKTGAAPKAATPQPAAPTPKAPAAEPAAPKPAAAANNTVTMGRSMDSRVIPYATEHGYGYYKGTPKFIPRSLDRVMPNTLRKVDLWFNKRWINRQMARGNKIVDIGEPPGMPSSGFYDMERRLTSGYWNYVEDFQP